MSTRSGLDLVWEIPLSVLSWLFFKINKGAIGWLYQRYLSRNLKRAVTWRVLSAETLSIPIILPVLMTKGPRWNTHGVIGTLGPFAIESTLEVNLDEAARSAQSWTVVVYSYPEYKTVTRLSWLKSMEEQNQGVLSLPKGYYSVGIRYYGLSSQAAMPTVTFDKGKPLAGVVVSKEINQFYETLGDRTNFYYLSLHYYIYTILRLRDRLSDTWVRSEYLPVGDPDTVFRYDCFRKEDKLHVEVEPQVFQNYWIYLSVYNRASLPIFSDEIVDKDYKTGEFEQSGYYLFRIRPKSAAASPLKEREIIISLI